MTANAMQPQREHVEVLLGSWQRALSNLQRVAPDLPCGEASIDCLKLQAALMAGIGAGRQMIKLIEQAERSEPIVQKALAKLAPQEALVLAEFHRSTIAMTWDGLQARMEGLHSYLEEAAQEAREN